MRGCAAWDGEFYTIDGNGSVAFQTIENVCRIDRLTERSSRMGKWFATIIAGVITGLIVWFLTEGYLSHRRELRDGVKSTEDNRPVNPENRPGNVPRDMQPNPSDSRPMALQIRPSVVPPELRPNMEYDISIMVLTDGEHPVEKALVRINVGGGSFLDTGNFTAIGNTDMQGVFKTRWRSLDPIPNGYRFEIRVEKDGLTAVNELMLNVFLK